MYSVKFKFGGNRGYIVPTPHTNKTNKEPFMAISDRYIAATNVEVFVFSDISVAADFAKKARNHFDPDRSGTFSYLLVRQ